jgi:hypothetical protein
MITMRIHCNLESRPNRQRCDRFSAGSSLGSYGASSPRNTLARIDCARLPTLGSQETQRFGGGEVVSLGPAAFIFSTAELTVVWRV